MLIQQRLFKRGVNPSADSPPQDQVLGGLLERRCKKQNMQFVTGGQSG
jgi:hypothetical protein